MNVDLPTPGTPETPTRIEPAAVSSSASSSRAAARWSARELSTSVIARLIASRRPSRTCAARDAVSTGGFDKLDLRGSGSVTELDGELLEQLECGLGDHGARREDGRRTHLLERRYVVGRDDATDHDHDVAAAEVCERLLESRDQREVTGRQGVDPDHVH